MRVCVFAFVFFFDLFVIMACLRNGNQVSEILNEWYKSSEENTTKRLRFMLFMFITHKEIIFSKFVIIIIK